MIPHGLEGLTKKDTLIAFATSDGKELSDAAPVEEVASFLVRWAAELYNDWAAWMAYVLPDCKFSYESSSVRIENRIKGMLKTKEVLYLSDGWRKITDMLRASLTC